MTGDLDVNATTLYVNGALTISGDPTANTDNLGKVYVTGATSVSGATGLSLPTTPIRATSAARSTTTPSTTVTDNVGPLYFVGNATFSSSSGNLSIAGGKNVHAGGTFTITAPTSSSSTVPCVFGSLYSLGNISITGNAVMDTTRSVHGRRLLPPGQHRQLHRPVRAHLRRRYGRLELRLDERASPRRDDSATTSAPVDPWPTRPRRRRCSPRSSPSMATPTATTTATAGPTTSCSATCGWTATPAPATSPSTSPHLVRHCVDHHVSPAGDDREDVHQRLHQLGHPDGPDGLLHGVRQRRSVQQHLQWADKGTFTGIAIFMEAAVEVTGGTTARPGRPPTSSAR